MAMAGGVSLFGMWGPILNLSPQEEVATFYAVMIKTDYMQKETFNRNFWDGFKALLGKGHVIKVGDDTTGTGAQIWALMMLVFEQACTSQYAVMATIVSGAFVWPATHAAVSNCRSSCLWWSVVG
jgi:Eukaryotic DNA topoisomerase I, DNA binding fragment